MAITAAVALNTLVAILVLGQNVPIGDDWFLVDDIRRYFDGTLDAQFLLRQHNEHRILFPRLYMLVIVVVSDWNLRCLMLSGFAAACLTYLLMCAAHHRDGIARPHDRSAHTTCLLAVFVFSVGQYQNWLWGWQITIMINVLSVVGGFYLLTGATQNVSTIAAAGAAGGVASFSFANGLLFWPIGLVLVIGSQLRRSHLGLWLVFACLSIGVYLHGYKVPVQSPDPWHSLSHPLQLATYVVTLLGGPFIYLTSGTKLLSGVVGLALLAMVGRLLLADPMLLKDRRLQFWLACGAYSLGSAVLTALGRAGLGPQQAAESRYLTIANLYWVMLVGVISFLLERNLIRPGRTMRLGYRALCVGVVAATVTSTVVLYRTWPSDDLAHVADQLRKDSTDSAVIRKVSKDIPRVQASQPFLKAKRLSYHAAR